MTTIKSELTTLARNAPSLRLGGKKAQYAREMMVNRIAKALIPKLGRAEHVRTFITQSHGIGTNLATLHLKYYQAGNYPTARDCEIRIRTYPGGMVLASYDLRQDGIEGRRPCNVHARMAEDTTVESFTEIVTQEFHQYYIDSVIIPRNGAGTVFIEKKVY